MKLSNLTLVLTDDCNFNCDYCVRPENKITMSETILEEAVDFFYPYLGGERAGIGFYGGEPLLAFDRIRQAVQAVEKRSRVAGVNKKEIYYTVTTNGMLLTPGKLDFFNKHAFALTLSFDGLAQELSRKKGTMEKMTRLVRQMSGYPHIDFEINSVFSPHTVHLLAGSIRFMVEHQGPPVGFNLNTLEPWSASDLEVLKEQLRDLSRYLVRFHKSTGQMPVKNFRSPQAGRGIFACGAGEQRMAVAPDGGVWGCYLFHDLFVKLGPSHAQYDRYYFGTLARFKKDFPRGYREKLEHYRELRQDFFQAGAKPCFLCSDLGGCVVCPANAAFSSGALGRVSCGQCELKKIEREARQDFLRARG